ncbi:hypothetical protein HF086_012465 [Spodoptera exigua]|uniref:C2H2-type domain-containing protein n=1 Tax=Spodoptera exigua TaxID=7107 RepID=A0A922M518_SPOEX|nr:hypothetical protein HF086_012465 [Spodoptera exigua]
MEGQPLNCPLCCNTTFSSKQSLVDHLSNTLENILCPLCNNKCSSLPHLIAHLSQESCQSESNLLNNVNVQSIIFEHKTEGNSENSTDIENADIKVFQNEINTNSEHQLDANEANKMYVELFTKQLKPCLQTRELKLIKENGESRYMIVTQEDTDLSAGNTIVTKNTDGTISLTTVKDMEMPTETMIATDSIPDDTQEEIYSCNTCKSEYLQEPIDDRQNDSNQLEYEPMDSEDALVTSDKQTPRRVITDTGDIVEEPILFKTDAHIVSDSLDLGTDEKIKIEQTEPFGVLTKRYIQVKTMSGGVIKDIGQANENEDVKDSTITEHKDIVVTRRYIPVDKGALKDPIQNDEKDKIGQFHKVVVKEVPTDCGFALKTYQCLACNISVTNLDEFKIHPCNILKYPCPYCPVAYENYKSLCAHMKAHKAKTEPHALPISYECGICNTVFPTNKSLKLHKRMHDPIKFKAHSVYNHHLLTHSEVRAYKCPFCPKAFKTSVQLAGHKNSHTKPFQCQHCNRPFASLYAVRVHTETHSRQNNLKFVCDICGASYARAFALKDHVQQAHNQDQESEASPSRSIPAEEDWMIKPNQDSLNKDLTHEIDLGMSGMSSNELIVP